MGQIQQLFCLRHQRDRRSHERALQLPGQSSSKASTGRVVVQGSLASAHAHPPRARVISKCYPGVQTNQIILAYLLPQIILAYLLPQIHSPTCPNVHASTQRHMHTSSRGLVCTPALLSTHVSTQVGNVYAYGESILNGWSPSNHACSTDPAATCPEYVIKRPLVPYKMRAAFSCTHALHLTVPHTQAPWLVCVVCGVW